MTMLFCKIIMAFSSHGALYLGQWVKELKFCSQSMMPNEIAF